MMDLMHDYKISHLGVHCLGQVLCEVEIPKEIQLLGS